MRATLRTVLRKSSGAVAFVLAVAATTPTGAQAPGVVLNDTAYYPEGPIVVDGGVAYAEMGADRISVSDATGTRTLWRGRNCGPTSIAPFGGGFVVLCHQAAALVVLTRAGDATEVITRDDNDRPFPTPNASRADRRGGVYFSSSGQFGPGAPATGAVLYLDANKSLRRVAEGIHYANGVALAPDGRTLYVSEHLSRNVLAYSVGDDGSLRQPRIHLSLDRLVGPAPAGRWEVGPDGLTTDRAGNLYIAEYGAGRLHIVSPQRDLLATVAVDGAYVTAPALSADERTIYVTAPPVPNPGRPGKVLAVPNPIAAD